MCPVSALFPEEWYSWIFDAISSDAPFSWGDTEHTLVTADRFKDWLEEVLSLQRSNTELSKDINIHKDNIFITLKKLEDLEVLIDLES